MKVEESLLLKRAKGKTFSDGVYEFSNSTRRSFLRRIRGGEQSSRQGVEDCKELAVYSPSASCGVVAALFLVGLLTLLMGLLFLFILYDWWYNRAIV